MQLYAKPITVQGAGVGGNGAIVNNNTASAPAGTQYDVSNVTLSGDTTIGGTSTTGTDTNSRFARRPIYRSLVFSRTNRNGDHKHRRTAL